MSNTKSHVARMQTADAHFAALQESVEVPGFVEAIVKSFRSSAFEAAFTHEMAGSNLDEKSWTSNDVPNRNSLRTSEIASMRSIDGQPSKRFALILGTS